MIECKRKSGKNDDVYRLNQFYIREGLLRLPAVHEMTSTAQSRNSYSYKIQNQSQHDYIEQTIARLWISKLYTPRFGLQTATEDCKI